MNREITYELDNKYITEVFRDLDHFRELHPKVRIVKIRYKHRPTMFKDVWVEIPECEGYSVNLSRMQVMNNKKGELCEKCTRNEGHTFYFNIKKNGKFTSVYLKWIVKKLGESKNFNISL